MFSSDAFEAIGCFFISLIIAVLALTVWAGYTIFTPTKIKSKRRIQPTIELVLKDNKVDTLFIYKK
ncbi:MAG: hypothetical protein ACTHLE_03575 [Agriterribacter sp.]